MVSIRDRIVEHGHANPRDLTPNPLNWRTHGEGQRAAMTGAAEDIGWIQSVIVNRTTGHIIDGHLRVEIAVEAGETAVPVAYVELSEDEERLALATYDRITGLAGADDSVFARLVDGLETSSSALAALLAPPPDAFKMAANDVPSLSDRFVVPPFSVLDARQGYWQERKRQWLALGMRSELGRGASLIPLSGSTEAARYDKEAYRARLAPGGSPRPAASLAANGRTERGTGTGAKLGNSAAGLTFGAGLRGPAQIIAAGPEEGSGTSIFDPVLCEIAYRWFCPPGGRVLDIYAGGSVRGIVAGALGRSYTGIDLSGQQIEANREQWAGLARDGWVAPEWIEGDSTDCPVPEERRFDILFTCPPYADLERYSDDPRDISTMTYPAFLTAYQTAIKRGAERLEDNRFAVIVVGDVRGPGGHYRDFPGDTIEAFEHAGLRLYNEAILVTAIGSLSIRAGRQFAASRKLGKAHQNVYVFVKGDPKLAVEACGLVEIADPAEMFGEVVE